MFQKNYRNEKYFGLPIGIPELFRKGKGGLYGGMICCLERKKSVMCVYITKEIVMKKIFFAVLCFALLLSSATFAEDSVIGTVVVNTGSGDNEVTLSWYHQMDFNKDDIVSYDEFQQDLRRLVLAADTDGSGTLTAEEAEASVALSMMVDIQCDVELTWKFWEMIQDCCWNQVSTDDDNDFMSIYEWRAWINTEQALCTPECNLPAYADCDEHKFMKDKSEHVTICHIPPGNPDKAVTTEISVSALESHLAHGDYCGPCAEDHFGKGEHH